MVARQESIVFCACCLIAYAGSALAQGTSAPRQCTSILAQGTSKQSAAPVQNTGSGNSTANQHPASGARPSQMSRTALMSVLSQGLPRAKSSAGYAEVLSALKDLLKGGTQSAIRNSDLALKKDDKLALAYAIRGAAYSELEDAQKVADDLNKAMALDPALAGFFLYDLRRRANSDLANWPAALADSDKLIALSPKEAWRFRERGEIYATQHKNDLAIADFNRSAQLEPKNYQVYKQRGDLFSHFGRYKEALADYNQTLKLCPTDAMTYGCRADCYEKLGQPELAKKDRAICNKKGFPQHGRRRPRPDTGQVVARPMEDSKHDEATTSASEIRIMLYPSDFSRSKQFYGEVISWPIQFEWDTDESKGVMFDTGCGVIELLWKSAGKTKCETFNLSLRVTDVWSLWPKMKDKAAVVFALRQNVWGDDSFCLADPDGSKLTFFTERA